MQVGAPSLLFVVLGSLELVLPPVLVWSRSKVHPANAEPPKTVR
jgi:hypothetical protein